MIPEDLAFTHTDVLVSIDIGMYNVFVKEKKRMEKKLKVREEKVFGHECKSSSLNICMLPITVVQAKTLHSVTGATFYSDMSDLSEKDLLRLKGFGPDTVNRIKKALSKRGYKLEEC